MNIDYWGNIFFRGKGGGNEGVSMFVDYQNFPGSLLCHNFVGM